MQREGKDFTVIDCKAGRIFLLFFVSTRVCSNQLRFSLAFYDCCTPKTKKKNNSKKNKNKNKKKIKKK